jgi:hypothetical protein
MVALTCDNAVDSPCPLKAVAPVRIRSGVPPKRALVCGNASQSPSSFWCEGHRLKGR